MTPWLVARRARVGTVLGEMKALRPQAHWSRLEEMVLSEMKVLLPRVHWSRLEETVLGRMSVLRREH